MAKKKPAAKRKAPHLEPAYPPPDNPLLRHEEMDLDRFSPETIATVVEALAAAAAPPGEGKRSRPPRGVAPAAASLAGGEMTQLARQRLAALQHADAMEDAVALGGAALALGAAWAAPADSSPPAPAPAQPQDTAPPVSGSANWTQLGPNAIPNGQTYSTARVVVTGRVTSIAVDPTHSNIVYVGTAQGGVWKSVDGCRNWKPKTDNEMSLAIGALALDPANPQILYAGTGEGNFSLDSYYGSGVLKTLDGGDNWTLMATPTFAGNRFSRIAVARGASQLLLAATNSGLYRSVNGGAAWTLLGGLPGAAASDVAIDPTDPARAYVAFWGQGVYRSTNANAAAPTWTPLAGGLATANSTRVGLAVAPSSPLTVYALVAGLPNNNPALSYLIDRFFRSTDGGDTWQAIPLPGGNIKGQGFYNLNLAVDPTTPDIVYLSGVSLWKATRNALNNQWTLTDIGGGFHPDNHALTFDPTNHQTLYAGSDGGLYRSTDGGASWDDGVNKGLCVTQFEFISQHPTSDALVLGGTQDNGTEQFRNSSVFYHSDDGDGGSCAIDANQPATMLSTYYAATPKRSTQAGQFGTWLQVSAGLAGKALFYPPMSLDATNPNNVAFGTDQIYLDPAQGTSGWPTQVALPGVSQVSAIHYVNSALVYAASTSGQVYRLTRTGTTWTAQAVHAPPLPNRYVWEVRARPDNADVVIVVMSGFGTGHVWRGTRGATGTAWADVSGTGTTTRLPNIPVNALAIDPLHPDVWFIGTDVGVFRTPDAGTTWLPFRNGLPNCAVFDLKAHATARLLRAATHGRGLWEIPMDATATPDVNLVLRDHLMDTGRSSPSPENLPAAWEDPLQHVNLGDLLMHWQCADVKVDAVEGSPPAYQVPVAAVDYLVFESRLAHRNPARGQVNRVYVQVRNRGTQPALTVRVKVLAADATLGLPPLPADFWTAFPADPTNTTQWHPVGAAKTIAVLEPFEPQILEWDWTVPSTAADHSCLLVVMESASDPIPAAHKLLNVDQLVRLEKRTGLKNLHVVSVSPATPYWTGVSLHGSAELLHTLRFLPAPGVTWQAGVVLQKGAQVKLKLDGVSKKTLTVAQKKAFTERLGDSAALFDASALYVLAKPEKGGALVDLKLPAGVLQTMLLLVRPAAAGESRALSLAQETGGKIVGGSTFALRVF